MLYPTELRARGRQTNNPRRFCQYAAARRHPPYTGAMFRIVLVAFLLLGARAASGCPIPVPAGLAVEGAAAVIEVVDGDTVRLDDGETVRLVGIQAPEMAWDGSEAWPLAPQARQALAELVLDRRVGLAYGGHRRDRYDRLLAHLVRADDGCWIQGALLEAGMALVYSFRDNRTAVADMLAHERRARDRRRGIWAVPFYRVRTAGEADKALRGFHLVEGTVRRAAVVRDRAYLNFGADWRTDFTISIAPRDRRLFEAEGLTVEDYAGRRVRVRGWVRSFNGPMIEATHPEQIEIIE